MNTRDGEFKLKKTIDICLKTKYIKIHELYQRHRIQFQRPENGIEDTGAPIFGICPIPRHCNTYGCVGKPYP
jgi:hypothetical protein